MIVRIIFLIIIIFPKIVFAQELPFRVLVSDGGLLFGKSLEPLQLIDDVSTIDIKDGGYVSLIHTYGTTYELKAKTFTFYLKPHPFKSQKISLPLDLLMSDSLLDDNITDIELLYPMRTKANKIIANKYQNLEIFWHLKDDPIVSYRITVSDADGNKIQDFRTKNHSFVLKHANYGLSKDAFNFQIVSSIAGETIKSESFAVEIIDVPAYQEMAPDIVLKALCLELSPLLALEAWQEALKSENGGYYFPFFEKFLKRNEIKLTNAGVDIEQLLLQNK